MGLQSDGARKYVIPPLVQAIAANSLGSLLRANIQTARTNIAFS